MADIYLDNCATTKPYPEVTGKVIEMLHEYYGNPSSLHRLGRESKSEVENARSTIADFLGAANEIYFTSGGTEANNLAIKGACLANADVGNKIITTAAEHAAVTKTIRDLKKQGWNVTYIPAPNGNLDLEELEQAIDEKTVLVSAMLVNNEIGAIFPIEKIKAIIHKKQSPALLHCDAVQGFGKLNFTAASLGVVISVSSHKIHGPKGIGALYVKEGTNMFSFNLAVVRSVDYALGPKAPRLSPAFAEAVKITFSNMKENRLYMKDLRDYCSDRISEQIPHAVIHSKKEGAPHIVNFSLPGMKNKEVVKFLECEGYLYL